MSTVHLPQLSDDRSGHSSRIRLERCPQIGCVEGDPTTGYELTLPVDRDGEIDALQLALTTMPWHIRRFERDRPDRIGNLARNANGDWVVRYGNDQRVRDDRFANSSRFLPNNIIGVIEDGQYWAYRVASVGPA